MRDLCQLSGEDFLNLTLINANQEDNGKIIMSDGLYSVEAELSTEAKQVMLKGLILDQEITSIEGC